MVGKVYLDHHTITRPFPIAVDAMLPFFREHWGSTMASHQMGQELFSPLNLATETILETLGAKPEDRFYFFSSHAEAMSHLFFSHYFEHVRHTGKNHILTTAMEEVTMLTLLKQFEELGCVGKLLPVNAQGQLTRNVLEEALKPRTSLLSLSWANALTGVIQPIADLAEACQKKDVRLHVDASAVIGRLYFRFEDLPIDILTFDGSLIHAPKGTAGMLVKENIRLTRPISELGGICVGGVVALAAALEEGGHRFDHVCLETARLRDKFERGIEKGCAEATVLFQKADRLPNCTAIVFPGAISEALLFFLHRKGVYATHGGGVNQQLAQILEACGIEERLAQCALSFSLSYETTEEDIEYAVRALVESVSQLQTLSEAVR